MTIRNPESDRIVEDARAADIVRVADRLQVKLRRSGKELVGACPAGCADHDGFSISPFKGLFLCRPANVGGNVIKMVMHARGCEFVDAVEFITGRSIRTEPEPETAEDCRRREQRAAEARRAAQRREAEAARDAERSQAIVAQIVAGLLPLRGTPGERYLRETRCIDTTELGLDEPGAIGWHRGVYFSSPDHPLHGQRLGCIVGVMSDAVTAQPTGAISRTYLDPGLRKVGKAKTLGAPAGVVRLTPDADVLSGLFLAEGLETALTAMSLRFKPIWSTGSTGLMRSFPVLNGIEALTIFVDHDENGAGEIAARECEARWLAAGREVRLFRSEQLGDINDLMKAA